MKRACTAEKVLTGAGQGKEPLGPPTITRTCSMGETDAHKRENLGEGTEGEPRFWSEPICEGRDQRGSRVDLRCVGPSADDRATRHSNVREGLRKVGRGAPAVLRCENMGRQGFCGKAEDVKKNPDKNGVRITGHLPTQADIATTTLGCKVTNEGKLRKEGPVNWF